MWTEKRTRKIRENIESSGKRHISRNLKPADIATRECRPKVLPQSEFHCPGFLKSSNEK